MSSYGPRFQEFLRDILSVSDSCKKKTEGIGDRMLDILQLPSTPDDIRTSASVTYKRMQTRRILLQKRHLAKLFGSLNTSSLSAEKKLLACISTKREFEHRDQQLQKLLKGLSTETLFAGQVRELRELLHSMSTESLFAGEVQELQELLIQSLLTETLFADRIRGLQEIFHFQSLWTDAQLLSDIQELLSQSFLSGAQFSVQFQKLRLLLQVLMTKMGIDVQTQVLKQGRPIQTSILDRLKKLERILQSLSKESRYHDEAKHLLHSLLKETLGDERFQEPHKIQFDDKYQKFFQSLLEKTPAADRLRELLRSLSKERLSKRRFWKLLQCLCETLVDDRFRILLQRLSQSLLDQSKIDRFRELLKQGTTTETMYYERFEILLRSLSNETEADDQFRACVESLMKDRGDDEQFKELLQNLWEETLFNEKVGNAFQIRSRETIPGDADLTFFPLSNINLMDMTTMRQRLASVSDTPAFLHDDKIVQTYPLTSENHQESKKKKTCLYHRVEEHVISQRKSILHGRDREIQGLKSGFWGDTPDKAKWMEVTSLILQVVTGLGGIGKSSLATHYAVEMREAYSGGVFFFNAVSCAALHDSVIQNMAVLSLKTDGLRKKVLEDNSLLLSHIRSRSKVLFIYDAVEDFDFLEKVLPPDNMAVHVLVTTRFGGDHRLLHSRACRIIRLGYLSPEDAKSALLSWARHENQSDEELEYSMKLVARLQVQGLPLAIAHIGTAVRQQNMSFRVYYELLESEKKKLEAAALNMDKLLQYFHVSNLREELAKAHINKPHELQEISSAVIDHVTTNPAEKLCIQKAQHWMNESSHVYLTWQFDIDTLRNKSRDAMEVLEYASLLSPKNIPGRVLQEMAFEMNDRRKLNKSIFDLSSHSLINEAKRNDMCTYDVHALVQLTVFHRLMIEKQNGNLDIKLSKLCRYLLRETAVGRENIEHKLKNCAFQQLLPHIYSVAEKVLMCGVQGDVYFNFVQNACWIALTAGHVDSADHLCRKQMKMTNWDGTDGYHVTALLQCGELYLDLLQQPSDAESYFSTAKQLLGLENCETDNIIISEHSHCAGTVLNGLARCHQEQHRYDSAEKMYLSVMKQDGCEGNVVTAMANLGLLYNVTGHLDKAIDMCQQALRKAPKNSTLASLIMNNFGRCLIDSGEFSEAAEILEQSLAITRRWKPDDHRDVAIVLKLLSICYVSLQNSSKAKQMAEESLCIIQSVVERRHRLLAPYISQLAECCNSLGDLDNCIEYKEQVVEIHRQHPVSERDLCAALTSLSMSYINKRMISEALATLKECVSMPEAFLSQQHFAQISSTLECLIQAEESVRMFSQLEMSGERFHQEAGDSRASRTVDLET